MVGPGDGHVVPVARGRLLQRLVRGSDHPHELVERGLEPRGLRLVFRGWRLGRGPGVEQHEGALRPHRRGRSEQLAVVVDGGLHPIIDHCGLDRRGAPEGPSVHADALEVHGAGQRPVPVG